LEGSTHADPFGVGRDLIGGVTRLQAFFAFSRGAKNR